MFSCFSCFYNAISVLHHKLDGHEELAELHEEDNRRTNNICIFKIYQGPLHEIYCLEGSRERKEIISLFECMEYFIWINLSSKDTKYSRIILQNKRYHQMLVFEGHESRPQLCSRSTRREHISLSKCLVSLIMSSKTDCREQYYFITKKVICLCQWGS